MRLPSPATVISLVALTVATGGTSYAALKITSRDVKNNSLTTADVRNNTLKSADVRNNTLKSADVRNGSLLAKDFRAGQLPAGPQGAQGPQGLQGPPGAPGSIVSAHATAEQMFLSIDAVRVAAVTITIPTRSRLVATGAVELGASLGGSEDQGACVIASGAQDLSREMTEDVPMTRSGVTMTGAAIREPGTHVVEIRCRSIAGTVEAREGDLTVVAAPV